MMSRNFTEKRRKKETRQIDLGQSEFPSLLSQSPRPTFPTSSFPGVKESQAAFASYPAPYPLHTGVREVNPTVIPRNL